MFRKEGEKDNIPELNALFKKMKGFWITQSNFTK